MLSTFPIGCRLRSLYVFVCLLTLATWAPTLSARPVSGTITAVEADSMALVVQIEGEAATRRVFVGPGDLAIARAGNSFRGNLVQQGPSWRLETLFPAEPVATATLERLGTNLQRDTLRRGRTAFRSVGERLPVFALWDQNGELFLSESLKGNYVLFNFVFTRCTVANMCPASTERMIDFARLAKEKGWSDVRLVSVTLDPAYDTPGIWTTYAESRGIDSEIHYLLGGPAETVEALKQQMGVLAEADAAQIIKHTMSTALIDPTGKIIYRLPGSMWSPAVFIRQLEEDRARRAAQ